MAGRLNRPLPPEPRTSGRSPQPVPRQTHGSPASAPRSRPPAPAPTEAYEEVPSLQRPVPPRPAPRLQPPTPSTSDEEYEEPDPVPPSANKNMPPTPQRQLLQRQLPKPPDSDEEYEAPAPEGPTEAYEEVLRPPQQCSAPRRRPPTPPRSDEEYEEPGADHQEHKHTQPLPRLLQRKLPPPPGGGEESEENESALRPPLPPPLPQQDEYLAPGQDMSGPTEEYSEIPGGMNTNHNVPAPPPLQIPDDLYQDMPDAKPEVVTTSSLQKELLGKKLKTATRELPPKPTQQKTIHGIQIMEGLDEGTIKNAKHGLKKVTQVVRDVVSEKSAKRDSSVPDPSDADFRTKAAKFGQKTTQHTALHKLSTQTVGQKDTPSPDSLTHSNTNSHTGRKADSSKAPEPPLPRLQETASVPQVPQTRPVIQPRKQRSVPDAPHSKKLSSYPWYFDSLSREDAVTKLKLMPQEGSYLIRSSAKDPSKPYTLSLFYKRKVWHLHLRLRSDGKFAVGSEKPEEECFASVPQLVEYYSQDPIILAEADKAGIRLIQHPTNDTVQPLNS